MAQDMMALVAERVDAGATDSEIIDELLSSYSGAVLLDPPASGNTLILWLAPLVVLAIGIGVIVWWKRHPGTESGAEPEPPSRGRGRLITGGVVLIAGSSLQERSGATAGVADLDTQNLDEVSNETMEAVVAANIDHPEINGMRMALAERYFEVNDYRSAFPHYLAVAESESATAAETATALVRLGWMAYDGNGEVDAAVSLIDRALEIAPGSQIGLYFKGQILWCGAGDARAATELFDAVLSDPELPTESRTQIEVAQAMASRGEACP
jgi:tetratricopeptide (TPR) repeat protein